MENAKNSIQSKENEVYKKCTCCNKIKPLTEFRKSGTRADGSQKYRGKCKSCTNNNTEIENDNDNDENIINLLLLLCNYDLDRLNKITANDVDIEETRLNTLKANVIDILQF